MSQQVEIEVSIYDSNSSLISTQKFKKTSIMVGRANGNDLQLEVDGVSRYHLRIIFEHNKLSVQDLGSTNGIFVNSLKVESSDVSEGDKILVGNAILVLKLIKIAKATSSSASKNSEVQSEVLKTVNKPLDLKNIVESNAPVSKNEVEKQEEPGKESSKESGVEHGQESLPSTSQNKKNSNNDFYWQSLKSFLSPVWDYLIDESVTEVLINSEDEIYIERGGALIRVSETFNKDQLNAAVLNIAQYVGRRVSEDEPYMDARLPDGSRVAVLLPPCARKGISISIRKFSKEKLTLDKLIGFGSLTEDMVTYLRACVLLKKNIIISGGTSSGKTSLLNVVSSLIPFDERILTIEDSAELQLQQDHVVQMETKAPDKKGRGEVTIRDLVRASLRMRPDRIVVGEIRSGEALDLLQAMNTGHSGSMATVHASSPAQALTRLETLALFSGVEIPMRALREQVSTAIEVVIQASRLPDHSRKVTYISEVERLDTEGNYKVRDIFKFINEGFIEDTSSGKVKKKIKGAHKRMNISGYLEEMKLAGLEDAASIFNK